MTNPCLECHQYKANSNRPDTPICQAYNKNQMAHCFKYSRWLGQQQGYAKGLLEAESKRGEVAREIVEWANGNRRSAQENAFGEYTDFYQGQVRAWESVESYCRSKGWLK